MSILHPPQVESQRKSMQSRDSKLQRIPIFLRWIPQCGNSSSTTRKIASKRQKSNSCNPKQSLVIPKKEYNRAKKLIQSKAISQGEYDTKLANFDSANARVSELKTQLAIAEENLRQTQRQYTQNVVTSKVNGIVSDVYFRLGEFVAQGNPILAILPPENVKIRFFVAEKVLPTIHYNQKVFVRYDNAPKEIEAKVSYIAPTAEYTPPIIYSVQSRNKLVFMIEATFENLQEVLNPGLPVSVRIP